VAENPALAGERAYVGDEMGYAPLITIGESPLSREMRRQREQVEKTYKLTDLTSSLRRCSLDRRTAGKCTLNGEVQQTFDGVRICFGDPQLEFDQERKTWSLRVAATSEPYSCQSVNGQLRFTTTLKPSRATAAFQCLERPDRAAVTICFPAPGSAPLESYGGLDAQAIARYELLRVLEAAGLAVEAAGVRLQDRRRLALLNSTDEPAEVRVEIYSKDGWPPPTLGSWNPASRETAGGWLVFSLPARSTAPLLLRDPLRLDADGRCVPIEGQRARVRVGNSGTIQEITLVDDNPVLGGCRAYESAEVETYIHIIRSDRVPQVKRVVLYRSGDGYFEHSGSSLPECSFPGCDPSLRKAILESMVMLDSRDEWRAEMGAAKEDANARVFRTSSVVSPRGTAEARIGYRIPVPVWQPKYRLTLASEWTLAAWAEIRNQSPFDWRDTNVRLRTGNPKAGAASECWQTFDLGNVTLARGSSALVCIGRDLPLEARLQIVYRDGSQSPHPREYVAIALTAEAKDAVPGGPLVIYDSEGYRFACDLAELGPKFSRQRLAFPDVEYRSIEVTKSPPTPIYVCTAETIADDKLSFVVSEREHHYSIRHHLSSPVQLILEVAEDPTWLPATAQSNVGAAGDDGFACVSQIRKAGSHEVLDLRTCDIDALRARRFKPDPVQPLIQNVIDQRESIASLQHAQSDMVARITELESCRCPATLVRQGLRCWAVKNCTHCEQARQIRRELQTVRGNLVAAQCGLDGIVAAIAAAISPAAASTNGVPNHLPVVR
jgi:hypothetical protein